MKKNFLFMAFGCIAIASCSAQLEPRPSPTLTATDAKPRQQTHTAYRITPLLTTNLGQPLTTVERHAVGAYIDSLITSNRTYRNNVKTKKP